MNFIVQLFVSMAVAYVLGGMPFGYWIGRLRGIDIREQGSGNIGATNVGRVLGRKWGVFVFFLDALKGFIPTLIAGHWLILAAAKQTGIDASNVELGRLLIGFSAFLGHNYSPFLGFSGGKGVATGLGVSLGIYPELTYPALIAFGVWALCIVITRYMSLSSILGAWTLFIAFMILHVVRGAGFAAHWPLVAFTLCMAAILTWRHRANIGRLIHGTEKKLGAGKPVTEREAGGS